MDLDRGSTKEATETAKSGAGILHELARQLKGELADEVAEEVAMARDLADELSRREAELGEMPDGSKSSQPGDGDGEARGKGKGRGPSGDLTDAERLERLEEAARTLEHWLKDASLRAEGPSAGPLRELVEQGDGTRVVERMEQIRELPRQGRKPDANREAKELSAMLERLARRLDVLHRGIISPEIARLVELDRRVAELTARLKHLETDADIDAWHRQAAELVRELEKAGLTDAVGALADAMKAAALHRGDGPWDWGFGDNRVRVVPDLYTNAAVKDHLAAAGAHPGHDPEGHGRGPRRGDPAGVQGAGRALLRSALESRRDEVRLLRPPGRCASGPIDGAFRAAVQARP